MYTYFVEFDRAKAWSYMRAKRESEGLTQSCLAEMLGLNQATVARREQGYLDISLDDVYRHCNAIGVTIRDFLLAGEREDE